LHETAITAPQSSVIKILFFMMLCGFDINTAKSKKVTHGMCGVLVSP
jgi:hypothetical protein